MDPAHPTMDREAMRAARRLEEMFGPVRDAPGVRVKDLLGALSTQILLIRQELNLLSNNLQTQMLKAEREAIHAVEEAVLSGRILAVGRGNAVVNIIDSHHTLVNESEAQALHLHRLEGKFIDMCKKVEAVTKKLDELVENDNETRKMAKEIEEALLNQPTDRCGVEQHGQEPIFWFKA